MLQKIALRATERHRGARLDRFLAAELASQSNIEVSRRRLRRFIADGAVYIDGRRIRVASRAVRPGARIDIYLDPSRLDQPAKPAPKLDFSQRILFEDDDLMAIDKPSGLPVQATVEDDTRHLLALLRRHLAERGGERPPLTLPHRLDRGTSGVQLVAKGRRASDGLAAAFRDRRVVKVYLALCADEDGRLPDTWTVENHLALEPRIAGPQGRRAGRWAVAVETGGKRAETAFRLVEPLRGAALVEARPTTGRTHQIRAHLADSGNAVLGDPVYGSPEPRSRARRLMLHASELHLEHPVSRQPLAVTSPLPEDVRQLLASSRLLDSSKT